MAGTTFTTGNALTQKLWRKQLFYESLKATYFGKFMGKDQDNLVQWVTETKKDKGDRITVGLRMQLTGAGTQGDGTLEGNEEALVTYSDNLYIDQLRHAVRSSGKMSEQRTMIDHRTEAKNGLRDWWADRLDTALFNQLCGNTAQTDTKYTGNQAAIAPDTAHRIFATGSADESQNATNYAMTLALIDQAVVTAKTFATGTTPIIRPIMVGGEPKYVCFLHPGQVYALRQSTASSQWLDIQKAAVQGGQISKNPIYTGALAEYNGVILQEALRVTQGVNSSTGAAVANTRRAVLCGAQAAIFAVGKDGSPDSMTWVEEEFDYENQLGVSAGMIFGMKKAQFNSKDFGVITISTYSAY